MRFFPVFSFFIVISLFWQWETWLSLFSIYLLVLSASLYLLISCPCHHCPLHRELFLPSWGMARLARLIPTWKPSRPLLNSNTLSWTISFNKGPPHPTLVPTPRVRPPSSTDVLLLSQGSANSTLAHRPLCACSSHAKAYVAQTPLIPFGQNCRERQSILCKSAFYSIWLTFPILLNSSPLHDFNVISFYYCSYI